MQKPATRASLRGQLSAAGILIGCVGCVVITASSVYTALKMGSLPWPTIFTSITALVLLRAVGNTSLNEANITQVIMSAGSMVAGGLAFTIPGVWILGLADEVSWGEMLAVALAGTLLGLVCTSVIRRRFVEQSDLPYPIGTAAAETLIASRAGGETGRRLFASMALAGLWSVARDILGLMPALISSSALPGVALGIQNSPMRLAVGFLAGRRSMAWWAFGAVVGWLGIVTGGTALGLWNVSAAQGIVSSLGMGLMMGAGVGVVFKDVILAHVLGRGRCRSVGRGAGHVEPARWPEKAGERAGRVRFAWLTERPGLLALMVAAAALVLAFVLRLPPVACAVIVTLSFVTAVMSAQSVGQSGIDPMEIFGLIVLLMVAALSSTTQVQLFFVAGVIAVACGLAGDVMSDFKTGQIIGTDPHVLWIEQVIGALLGTGVAVAVLVALVAAYGPNAFGPDALFVSAQANVVATMVAGIPSVPAFVLGLAAGGVLYVAGIPSMMLGLGVYLPFYMTLTTVLGALVRLGWDRLQAARGAAREEADEAGIVMASGVLGGESIVGVVVALATAAGGLLG
ncbi:OPT/YSL family transporter [Collinsella intestinalis]|uniref:OPT/YSL family transporter n=1 Tax=Collinsella intestinalis TaxID=147207 RepID=UPI00195AB61C|nr:OPT/YSL family transporter [Collinsella intestinalis]MBM6682680.1 OPT/YSL family transporter [Collinsella intestinalis]